MVQRKDLYNYYVRGGRAAHGLMLPILRIYIRHTRRAYVVFAQEAQLLLIKNWFGDGKWGLPGGGIKKGESPPEAATRELEEELRIRLQPSDLHLITSGRWKTDNLGFRYFIYISTIAVEQFEIDRKELVLAKWVNAKDLTPTNTSEEIQHAINKALSLH